MRFLLDTHVLLWWLADDPHLPHAVRSTLATEPDVFVSAATAWEIAIKRSIGKLEAPADLIDQLDEQGFRHLPMDWDHTVAAGALAPHHRDPFDRMLVAQAELEDLVLVTADPRMAAYGVKLFPS